MSMTGCGRCPFCQQFPASSATRFEHELLAARAQLAEAKEAVKIQNGVIVANTKKLIAARADAERRLLVIQKWVALEDLAKQLNNMADPMREPNFVGLLCAYSSRKMLLLDAARREGKDHQT